MIRVMKKIALLGLVVSLLILINPTIAEARKVLPRWLASPIGGQSTKPASSKSGKVTISIKFRSDRKGVIATLNNLNLASNISYTLSYMTNGVGQEVGGTIKTDEASVSKEIIFGTCSGGKCRYDTNITNAKLTFTITMKNGIKIIKPFKLKV